MTINLIRHGRTKGNSEKRYIGRTDEPLSGEGEKDLQSGNYPDCEKVYVSPMLRCRQSAQIIYPAKTKIIIDDFRECDFGIFEGHNYEELSDNPLYTKWLDSYGTMDFPQGEGIKDFKMRTVRAFDKIIEREMCTCKDSCISIVAHGGTIMAILERYESLHDYYRWQAANGCGYICEFDDNTIKVIDNI